MIFSNRIAATLRRGLTPLLNVAWVPFVYALISSLGTILSAWERLDMTVDKKAAGGDALQTVFDFIIVGAGTAGCVVANRLSKHYNVLLLEAGGDMNPLQYIPGFEIFLINHPASDWRYRTVPQTKASLNSIGRRSSWSAGRMLGGTGSLNIMIHLRGHTRDFDNWARITNDSSWSYEGVLPFFKSHENYEQGSDPRYHGYGGDLNIEIPDYTGLGKEFVAAGNEFGYPAVDLNDPFNEGFGIIRMPVLSGVRHGPYIAFLQKARRRNSLTLRKYAHVNRIIFQSGNVASGVEYDRHGKRYIAYAKKEVILSAGTMGSAKLLMLSGVGPGDHLRSHGIPVISDLPVGHNLQDHIAAYVGPIIVNQPRTLLLERDLRPSTIAQWFAGGRGGLSSTGAVATGCITSSYAKARGEASWPDVQLFMFNVAVFEKFAETFSFSFSILKDELIKYYQNDIGKDSFLLAVSGARPFSRGYIKLNSKDPYDDLIIDPRYMTDPDDIDFKAMHEGVQMSLRLVENSTALGRNLGARLTKTPLPGCEHLIFRSSEYWECFIRRYTVTLHHPVGTCAMGANSSPYAVVDSRLRVRGVHRLRVIDGSVQPVLVVTNTQASIFMIGEKGATMVLEDWQDWGKK